MSKTHDKFSVKVDRNNRKLTDEANKPESQEFIIPKQETERDIDYVNGEPLPGVITTTLLAGFIIDAPTGKLDGEKEKKRRGRKKK